MTAFKRQWPGAFCLLMLCMETNAGLFYLSWPLLTHCRCQHCCEVHWTEISHLGSVQLWCIKLSRSFYTKRCSCFILISEEVDCLGKHLLSLGISISWLLHIHPTTRDAKDKYTFIGMSSLVYMSCRTSKIAPSALTVLSIEMLPSFMQRGWRSMSGIPICEASYCSY